jgi:hypothetical protein
MVTINWNTASASIGDHMIVGSHDFADDNAANDSDFKIVTVTGPNDDIHVGDLDGTAVEEGKTWTATVAVTIHDTDHSPVAGVHVSGSWSASGASVNQCTTASDGTCTVTFTGIKRKSVSFTVTAATLAGRPYQPAQNHDDDDDSNGSTIVVTKP